jgi:RNA-directed DNA polymerase
VKRTGYIYENICDIENIKKAILKSSLGKRDQHFVKKILSDIDNYALKVQKMLAGKSYVPSPYTTKTIQDGARKKERTISIPRYYPDQIIHWALMLQLEPIIMRGMYEYNCGSVPGRGTRLGQRMIRRWLDKEYKNTKYCFKMDISKFYPSVDIDILKSKFRCKIKDRDCLWLIDSILDSYSNGLPIGNYTSQWFANFYLQDLDHFIKEQVNARFYIRYIDDLVILGANKKELHKARKMIFDSLGKIHLTPKGDWQVFLVSKRSIDFLGFRFYRDRTTLRKRNALRIRRRVKKISRKGRLTCKDAQAVVSYWGWIKHSNSYKFYDHVVRPIVTLKQAKGVVSKYARTN